MARKSYTVIACRALWREIAAISSGLPRSFDLVFLRQGLHLDPPALKAELQETIDKASMADPRPAEILLAFGLCQRALSGIAARDVPLVVPRAHDCLTLLLGSKEKYAKAFSERPGTYWYTPGWIEADAVPGRERYEKLRADYAKLYGDDNADYLVDIEKNSLCNYGSAAFLSPGGFDDTEFRASTRECAAFMGWDYLEETADTVLIRDLLSGDRDEDRFLAVPPGRTVEPSYDDTIIKLSEES